MGENLSKTSLEGAGVRLDRLPNATSSLRTPGTTSIELVAGGFREVGHAAPYYRQEDQYVRLRRLVSLVDEEVLDSDFRRRSDHVNRAGANCF